MKKSILIGALLFLCLTPVLCEANPLIGEPWILVFPFFSEYDEWPYSISISEYTFLPDGRFEERDTDQVGAIINKKVITDEYSILRADEVSPYSVLKLGDSRYFFIVISQDRIALYSERLATGISSYLLLRGEQRKKQREYFYGDF